MKNDFKDSKSQNKDMFNKLKEKVVQNNELSLNKMKKYIKNLDNKKLRLKTLEQEITQLSKSVILNKTNLKKDFFKLINDNKDYDNSFNNVLSTNPNTDNKNYVNCISSSSIMENRSKKIALLFSEIYTNYKSEYEKKSEIRKTTHLNLTTEVNNSKLSSNSQFETNIENTKKSTPTNKRTTSSNNLIDQKKETFKNSTATKNSKHNHTKSENYATSTKTKEKNEKNKEEDDNCIVF